ncbi:MAG: hypothetical protein IPJ81_18145 [Chitinophagaceae bacterium]|nr:hypothetical protein [Chitinophagaceae bacterium]
MKFIPILFSTPMVQAILAGRKTMTRRIVKPQPTINEIGNVNFSFKKHGGINVPIEDLNKPFIGILDDCPYGQLGDVLWVRETWCYMDASPNNCAYKEDFGSEPVSWNWKPSIYMSKEVCRLFLKVKSIKVERLQDITEEDAIAEGVQDASCTDHTTCPSSLCKDGCSAKGTYYNYPTDFDGEPCYSAVESFEQLWQSINGEKSWDANPWVWVIKFERIEKPENFK